MSGNALPEAEAELEVFRQRWRDEVTARNRRPGVTDRVGLSAPQRAAKDIRAAAASASQPTAGPATARRKDASDFSEELEPKAYHDLPDKEEVLRLGAEAQGHERAALFKEPSTALEHYEHAVDKETTGQLGDSIAHYRKAFRLDSGVHEAYKTKHFPPSSFVKPKPEQTNPSNAAGTVPGTAHHSLDGSSAVLPQTLKQLIEGFSTLRIEPPPPATDASPLEQSRIAELPEEILTQIMLEVALKDVASFARLAQVCKRLAYLVLTEEAIWKRVATGPEFGFKAMKYDFQCDIDGFPLDANDAISQYIQTHDSAPDDLVLTIPTPEERAMAFSSLTASLLRTTYANSWRQLFRSRPRIRFNGCYISTVNYTRPGATNTNSLTWGSPIHVVTYYRYLRFFRDGTAISLLTTTEPADVVHHLTPTNLHAHHRADSLLPSAVMKDGLRGRWRLSGPASLTKDPSSGNGDEPEGEVHVETQGATSKYTYRMLLQLSHAGKGARNNKLAWKGYWSHSRVTDDVAEFGLRHDKAFYWSRVRSFGTG
ncbi:hypothetical protein LTR62_002614 [Meristemomyces frigidus]|uniref:F-box domain-containing protein n=1 Tax=Meristemomyces frigidus TaxID=1508187 RepID=A0AAN7TR94_9PEZI|nr:hypothetical protein LTR62_002614 [Meristemomyces frigidus]